MSSMFQPSYIKTIAETGFDKRIEQARQLLSACTLCPRNCGIDRTQTNKTPCKTGKRAVISSAFPHFGEEEPLSGSRGSGTIFVSGCNLQCAFCQNFEISHLLMGEEVSCEEIADMMLNLQQKDCHNINIVTPTHIVPILLKAVKIAAKNGLKLPLVYNSSGYDAPESLKLLEGIFDIYMPDFKFLDDRISSRYFAIDNYGTVVQKAILEMYRQVGNLQMNDGIATRGLLIRHLVMPGFVEESRKIFHFIANEISTETYVNVMPQYYPAGRANVYPEINRKLYRDEYYKALIMAEEAGLTNINSSDI